MDRRRYLSSIGVASTVGFTLFAGCSGGDGSDQTNSSGEATSGGNGSESTDVSTESGVDVSDAATSDSAATDDEALATGQAPPDETGTPFQETNTVPEEEGLETGQAPNATAEDSLSR